jgi:hypothetical protein
MKLPLWLALLLCACGGSTPPPPTDTPQPARIAPDTSDPVRIEAPAPDAVVTSPLRVAGTARGPWFFEATFPITLLDAHGTLVARSFVQAQGEWMTTEFVLFEGQLIFDAPSTLTGTLVLEKANASGLPEHADALRVPVRFVTAPFRARVRGPS